MILVINLGLKSIRAIVFDMDGRKKVVASSPINSRLYRGMVEQSAEEWKIKMFQVVSEAAGKLEASNSIRYITVSCSASCLVVLDKDMNSLAPVVMVSDKRAISEGAMVSKSILFDEISKSDGYKSTEYSQMSRILWHKYNNPDIYAKAHKFLSPNDYLLAILSGGLYFTDPLNAEKFYYSANKNSYPVELYEEFEISTKLLPECVEIGTNLGRISFPIAKELALSPDIELIVSTYDAIASVFGTGVSRPGLACDVSGTVMSVRLYSKMLVKDKDFRIVSQYYPPTGDYLVGGSNNLGGGVMEWFKQSFYFDAHNPYELIQAEASNSYENNKNSSLIFLPHLLGARAPLWNSNAKGVFFGVERHHARGDFARAAFESLAYSVKEFIDIFKQAGLSVDYITASGGLARMPIANQLKATIVGIPYHCMEEFESTSLGAAIIVMCAINQGLNYSEVCQDVIVPSQIFLPQKKSIAFYEDMYELYKEVYACNEPLYEKHAKLVNKYNISSTEYIENL